MKLRRLGLCLSVFSLTLFLFACGGGGEQRPADSTESKPAEGTPSGPVTTVDPATAATIAGKVSFEGEKPKPRQIRMDAEASCATLHKEPVYAEEVVVNDNNTLQYVFVYVKEGLGDKTFRHTYGTCCVGSERLHLPPARVWSAGRPEGQDSQ